MPEHSYFVGFVQGDGHLSRNPSHPNKGKLEIELSIRDVDILHKFHDLFPDSSISYRKRDTNFKQDYECATFRICNQAFRERLEFLGVPVGKKSEVVRPPLVPFRGRDYWRGIIDSDGSLGITSKGLPYVSLVTTSEHMARAYEQFIFTFTGKHKTTTRNVRDRAYNIALFREDAVKLASAIYYEGSLCLERKKAKALEVCSWVRPSDMRVVTASRKWTDEEDDSIFHGTVAETALRLARSESSIMNRRHRLIKLMKHNDKSAEGSA